MITPRAARPDHRGRTRGGAGPAEAYGTKRCDFFRSWGSRVADHLPTPRVRRDLTMRAHHRGTSGNQERLNRFLARAGGASRRGRRTDFSRCCAWERRAPRQGPLVDHDVDRVTVNGPAQSSRSPGTVHRLEQNRSASSPRRRRSARSTVLDSVGDEGKAGHRCSVGRLDADTTAALLTDDGDLPFATHRATRWRRSTSRS